MYEAILYVLAETLAWYTSVYEYPKASKWFYYANREDVEVEPRGARARKESEIDNFDADDNGGLKTIEI